jgi:hypothetical protein
MAASLGGDENRSKLKEHFEKVQELAGDNCRVDFAHLDRNGLSEDELGALSRFFKQSNSQKDVPGVVAFMPYANFGIGTSGLATGFCAVFKDSARLYRSPFGYDWFNTRAVFAIKAKNKELVRLTPSYFQNDAMREQLKRCIAEKLPSGARGYDATIINDKGRYADKDRVPVMGNGDSRVGIVSFIAAHDTTKRNFFIVVDVNQPSLSAQVNTLLDLACVQNLTLKELMTSTELKVDGVSAAIVFAHGEEIALRAAHALASQVAGALNVSFVKCNPDLMSVETSPEKVPVAAAVTAFNMLYAQKSKSGTDNVAYYNNAVNTRGHGTIIFPRLAINGYTAVCGLPRKKGSASIFDTLPWSSREAFDGIPADMGRACAIDELNPDQFVIEKMAAEVREKVGYSFVFEDDADGVDEVMNHQFCRTLYAGTDSDEALAQLNSRFKRAFKACTIDGSSETLQGIPLSPVLIKVASTPLYDLPFAPGDTLSARL